MRLSNKILLFAAAALLASCSQNDDQLKIDKASEDDVVEVPVTFNLSIDDNMVLIGSRAKDAPEENAYGAPRFFSSWQGQQAVNDVRVYVFTSETADGDYLFYSYKGEPAEFFISEFDNPDPWTDTDFEFYSFTINPKLQKGRYYKFLVVARDDKYAEKQPAFSGYARWGYKTLGDIELTPGETKLEDVSIANTLKSNTFPFNTTEVFSAADTEPIYVDPNVRDLLKYLTLTRAVAGLWIYVTDIPTVAVDNVDFPGELFYPDELTMHLTIGAESMLIASQSDNPNGKHYPRLQIGYVDFRNIYYDSHIQNKWMRGQDGYWKREALEDYYGMNINSNSAIITNFIFPIDESYISEDQCTLSLLLRQHIGDETKQRLVKCRILSLNGSTINLGVDPLRFPILPNRIYALGTEGTPLSLASLSADNTPAPDPDPAPAASPRLAPQLPAPQVISLSLEY